MTLQKRVPSPITLRHLLTHTAGFEDRLYALFTDAPSRMPTLLEYLQRNVPQQIWVPGETVAYSNYGAALAGRIVENLAGVSFEEYVEQAIFAPLGMRSTFSQTLTDDWKSRLSQGYVVERARPVRKGIEYVTAAPAGAMSASAQDMAYLMLELVNPATSAVLTSDAKALLFEPAESAHPELNGLTLGLYEMTRGGGERALGHGGDTMLFHSRMVLWPEQQLGLFVSTNTATGADVVENLVRAFVEHYVLAQRQAVTAVESNLQPVVGHYGTQRRAYSGPLKLLALLGQVKVSQDAESGGLLLSGVVEPQVYLPQGENLFYSSDGLDRAYFKASAQGPDQLFSSLAPMMSFARLPWFERADLNLLFVVIVLLANVVVVIRWPYTLLFARASRVGDGNSAAGSGIASLLAWVLALTIIAVCSLYVLAVPDPVSFMLGGYRALNSLNWGWVLISLGAIMQLVYALGAWRRRHWWLGRRAFYGLVALLNLGFAGWMYYWNLHPFSLPVA